MKLSIILPMFSLLCLNTFAADTTIVTDVNYDRSAETIKFTSDESGAFTLKVNNQSVNGQFFEGYDAFIKIIDIDNNDNLREIAAGGYGSSDAMEWFFYQFIDGKIIPCGHLPGNFGIKTTGNKIVKEHVWMGFYSLDFRYRFDTENKTLTYIHEYVYDIDVPAEVTKPFSVLKYRYDNSEVVKTLKPKIKIALVKVDLTPQCNDEISDYRFDDNCDWFLVKTEDGIQGWCRLKDFMDNVEGLIWAG
jgi:hypothetical protein